MGYPLDYPLELDSPEHYVFESEDLEDEDIIPIGSTVRSYDFVVGKHILRDDCYFEGVIEKFEPVPTCSPNCNHYIVRTTKIVRNGEEEDIVEGSNDYFSTHWNNYGVIPLEIVEPEVMESEWFNEMKFVEHYPMESHGFEWRGYTYQDGDISISVDGPNGIISYDDKLEKELPKKVAKNYLTDNGIPFERLERGDYNLFYFTFPNNGETCYQHDWMGNECRYCNFRMSLNRAESFEADSYFPCEACDSEDDPNNLDTKRTQIRVDDGDAGIKLDICDSCLEKWYAGVLFDEEDLEGFHYLSAETYTPPAAAVTAAKKGLSQRKKWGRGGLSPAEAKSQEIDSGVTRARKIASGKVSRHDVRRMSAFNRHRKNNKPSKKMPDGGPTAGTIAWNLWGGTSGVNWAKKKSATMNAEEWTHSVSLTKNCSCGREVQPYEFEMEYDEYYKKNYVRAKYRCDCGGGKCRGRIRVGSYGNSRPCTRTAEYRGYCNECSTCERCDISLKQDYEEMGRDEGHKHGFCHQCYDDTARYGAETLEAEIEGRDYQ